MGPFSADLKQLALAAVLGATAQRGSRHPIALVLMILSAFLFLAAAVFLMAAIYSMLYTYYNPMTAQLYMGVIIFSCALICALTALLVLRVRSEKMKSYHKILIENIHHTFDALTDELEEPIRENPKTAAIIAGIAGYAAGQKLH